MNKELHSHSVNFCLSLSLRAKQCLRTIHERGTRPDMTGCHIWGWSTCRSWSWSQWEGLQEVRRCPEHRGSQLMCAVSSGGDPSVF